MFKKSVQQQSLSYHYTGNPKQFKNNKLNFFGKAIAILDTLPIDPHLLASVRDLDLSHNAIYQIQNIEQFYNAEFVNLSHNRIVDAQQVLKLQGLQKLHTLYLKGNPFLRGKLNARLLSFLLSLNTDVQVISGQVSTCIETYSLKSIQNYYFKHYLNKIQIHIQLANNYQLDESFLNPALAIFPKIKKIFEQLIKENTLKRHLVNSIPREYFEDEKLLVGFLKGKLEEVQKERSEVIKRIYEREELLRNVRSTYKQRVVPKRIVMRNMGVAGGIGVNHYSPPRISQASPPKLKESIKQSKIVSKVSRNIIQKQNSPVRLSSQIENEQAFLNALIKLNPLYHLLHSPLPSLKSHEKDLLIQNLCLHLKEKFKDITKYEKKEQEYLRAKEESSNLEEHLKEVSSEMKDEQQKTNSKLKKLSTMCQEEAQKVQALCDELSQYKKELVEVRTKNSELKEENGRYKQKIAKMEEQQRVEQVLLDKTRNNLQRKVIRILTHKAYHFSQLVMLQQINRKVEEKELKECAFQNLREGVKLSKGQFALKAKIVSQHFRNLLQSIRIIQQHAQLKGKVSQRVMMMKKKSALLLLKTICQKQKHCEQKISKLRRKIAKRTKQAIFALLKEQLDQKHEEQQWSELSQYSKVIALRKYLRLWKKYIQEIDKRTEKCTMQLQSQRKTQAFNLFVSKCQKDLSYRSGVMATESFLAKIRKINGYLRFSKIVGSTLSSRKIKKRKVQLIRQHQYLYWFISTIRDRKIKKRILVQREIQVRKRLEEEERKKFKNNKTHRLTAFLSFIRQARGRVIERMLNRQKNWMEVSDQREAALMKGFICKIRAHWISRFKLSAKSELLKRSVLVKRRVTVFLNILKARKEEVNRLEGAIKRDKLVKCFFRWKCFNLWRKMQAYKEKFLELEPEITHISHMQKEGEKQKELLLLEIEEKELILRDYQKKCEEYEYMLHSKDVKYDKLRQIYSESMHQHELSASVEDTPKYIGEMKGRYSFKTKIDEDNYLKSFSNHYKAELLGKETVQRANGKNRDTFISSFKRF